MFAYGKKRPHYLRWHTHSHWNLSVIEIFFNYTEKMAITIKKKYVQFTKLLH